MTINDVLLDLLKTYLDNIIVPSYRLEINKEEAQKRQDLLLANYGLKIQKIINDEKKEAHGKN